MVSFGCSPDGSPRLVLAVSEESFEALADVIATAVLDKIEEQRAIVKAHIREAVVGVLMEIALDPDALGPASV
jgi:hypothetical protein